MAAHVIQFARLEEFVAEELSHVVRVTALDVTESSSSRIPGLRLAAIGVHVRTINREGHILACTLPVASVEIYEAVLRMLTRPGRHTTMPGPRPKPSRSG